MKTKLKLIVLCCFLILQYACSNSDSSSSSAGMTITGIVTDENENPISGANVKSGSSEATTDADGAFTLTGVAFEQRTVVAVRAAGYFDGYRGFEAVSGQDNRLDIMMESKGTPTNFNSSAGATLNNSGGSVVIASNTVMDADGNDYSGPVKAYLRMHNPSQSNFSRIMQGGDFAAQNAAGTEGILSSFGFYSVEMEDASGNLLNIKTGASASFTLPIAASQLATAQSTIKLWSFDKTLGMWKEEGTATKVGNNYVGTVSHFSQWNCDLYSNFYILKGRIVCGADGQSTQVTVTQAGTNNELTTVSGSAGYFQIRVPQGVPVTVNIQGYPTTIAVPAQSTAAGYDLGTIDLCPGQTTQSLAQILSGHTWITNQCMRDNDGYCNSITFNSNGTWSASPSFFVDEPFEAGEYPISWRVDDTVDGSQIIVTMRVNTGDPENPFEVVEEYFGLPVASFNNTTVNFFDVGNGCPEKITRQ